MLPSYTHLAVRHGEAKAILMIRSATAACSMKTYNRERKWLGERTRRATQAVDNYFNYCP